MSSIHEIISPVSNYLELFEKRLTEYLTAENDLIYRLTRHLFSRSGKRMRPVTLFLSACAAGEDNDDVVIPAIAIELIHTATLLHDDVIDQSYSRRGLETVNSRWGNLVAVLTGDYYFAKAFKVLVADGRQGLLQAVSAATERVSVGELAQVQELNNTSISEDTYIRIITDKTASLFACAGECGAITAGANGKYRKSLARYGENLGIAFQITDDLLDYIGDEEKMGKGVGSDLEEGWFTLPLVYSLYNSSPAVAGEIKGFLDNGFHEDHFDKILDFVHNNGGVDYTREKALMYKEKALSYLDSVEQSEYREALVGLAEFTVSREK